VGIRHVLSLDKWYTAAQMPMQEVPAAAALIERAFALARQSGKSDWWAMTIPVLKNRLLQVTKNTFKESDFGATSFRDFLAKVPDIVRVDGTSLPGVAILKSAAPKGWERPSRKVFRREQIRADLWRAVLDYSSGRKYVWDISEQAARLAKPEDDGLPLPTISDADLDGWRVEFVASHKPTDPEVAKRVEEWCKKRLPTLVLPAQMRPAWNRYLKRKVEQRLQDWFGSNSLTLPAIMEEREASDSSDKQVETLREFVVCCVRTMSKQELLELRISPVTAMRALQGQKSSGENER
jgi:hypothetical protein